MKARLYIQRQGRMEIRTFDSDAEAYAVWLALPKGTRAAFRGSTDSRPVYSWDLVDRL